MHPVLALRAFFLLSSAVILLIRAIPSLNFRFLAYGSRTTKKEKPDAPTGSSPHPQNGIDATLDKIAALTVPHSWFTGFYVTITALCSYWILEILGHGPIFTSLARAASEKNPVQSMTTQQVLLTWLLMTIQGVRRLYESLAIGRPSNSRMWIVHWILGNAFYVGMSVSVWIEGSPALLAMQAPALEDLRLPAPTLRTFIALPIFILASGAQNDAHRYLASLRSSSPVNAKPMYKIPEHPLFVSAPRGNWINWTVASALVFVLSNLAVTADGTKKWYEERFGENSVAGKWRMIPYVF
ncbi:MAG: 3-oxo-5-alpha-steroid 4-dehydrogenase [Bogoriella megaspora]|nr:MAG: 3-oxo-5-alpha-steroid 4-dehydrogenase [Bogoriella megaspora]